MLAAWEEDVNDALDDLNDCADGGKKAKLTATKKVPAPRGGKDNVAAAGEAKAAPKAASKRKAAVAAGASSSSQAAPGSDGKRHRGK